jgi:hypothetical protein
MMAQFHPHQLIGVKLGMDIVEDWALVDTQEITLVPSEEEVAEWKLLDTLTITLAPSTEEVSQWKLLDTMIITLKIPTIACLIDADCPEGYICDNGICVPKGGFPSWLLGSAAAAGVILLVISRKKAKGK